jgi:integrase
MGELKKRGQIWWVRYYRNGRRHEESSHSDLREDAVRLLKVREGDVARGLPVTPKIGRLRFDEAAEDVLNDYRVNGKRSLDDVQRRFTLHLTPFFGGRRLSTVTTPDVRVYVAQRQKAGASNSTVNRELTVLKRAFSLALQSGKLLAKPHIPMLRENNARTGFFEADQLASVLAHLPAPIQPVIRFAAITGWRTADEVLPLEWRQVDFSAGEVRLDVGTTSEGRVFTTKNDEGRGFPITEELRAVLDTQHAEHPARIGHEYVRGPRQRHAQLYGDGRCVAPARCRAERRHSGTPAQDSVQHPDLQYR